VIQHISFEHSSPKAIEEIEWTPREDRRMYEGSGMDVDGEEEVVMAAVDSVGGDEAMDVDMSIQEPDEDVEADNCEGMGRNNDLERGHGQEDSMIMEQEAEIQPDDMGKEDQVLDIGEQVDKTLIHSDQGEAPMDPSGGQLTLATAEKKRID